MSSLLVDELLDNIIFDQPFRITRDCNLTAIRPWIYKHGTLTSGVLTCRVYQDAELLATSEIPFTQINEEITGTYAHGFIRFSFPSLQLRRAESEVKTNYRVEFEMIGHTSGLSAFVGIVRQYERKIYPTYGDGVFENEAPNDFVEPAGLELFELTYI